MLAMTIALYRVSSSGEQWLEDGPRYLNNAAMIHDFLVSGDYLDPVGFAKQNYVKYPAHNVPYHPPGYAFFLAVWFQLFGMSYVSARCFIACCTAGLGIAMYGILRLQEVQRIPSFLTACLLLLFPEVALWSRTGMSELPALMFIAFATYVFLRALKFSSPKLLWGAYSLALCAFFCRVSSAGILPCWGLAFLLARRQPLRFWLHYLTPSLLYIAIGIAWVKFASHYSQHEMRRSVGESLLGCLNSENLLVWWTGLPTSVGWGAVCLCASSCLIMWRTSYQVRGSFLFWMAWIAGCYGLVVAMGAHHEHRYFIFALPGIAGLCQATSVHIATVWQKTGLALALLSLVAMSNLPAVLKIDDGLVGFQKVADYLASCEEEGNVMLASHLGDSDIIFRYRSKDSQVERTFFRSDRTFAIRLADYYRADHPTDPVVVADTEQAGIDLIRRGRVRYMVTWEYNESKLSQEARCHDDVLFASSLANTRHFSLVNEQVITRKQNKNRVKTWRYNGELPPGLADIDVPIPTANLILNASE